MLLKILTFAGISAAIYLVGAVGLILSQRMQGKVGTQGVDFSSQLAVPSQAALKREHYTARDGAELPILYLPSEDKTAPLLILVHGSGWYGQQFDALALELQDVADVLVPDLRGHGENPQRRGDIDYIGQFEDDLADLIKVYAREDQKVILAGHSSGGGLVVRFAGGKHGGLLDGAILLAPFLKYNAPTMRENSGGWAHTLIRRLIGLSMLNNVRITALNHLDVIQFSMPRQVLDGPFGHMATLSYSYRLNQSYAPRNDYLKDIAALPPFILIVGVDDEAFIADQYQGVMQGVSDNGQYHLVQGASHLEIVNNPATLGHILPFINELK